MSCACETPGHRRAAARGGAGGHAGQRGRRRGQLIPALQWPGRAREAVAERLLRQTGVAYDAEQDVVITCGGTEGLFDALLATVQEGDEVIVTDPPMSDWSAACGWPAWRPSSCPSASRGRLAARHRRARGRREERTRALFVMNPSMPSGAVLDAAEWEVIGALCRRRGCWLIYNAAMERIFFDGHPLVQPAGLDGLAIGVITVGSVSKEWRMIGWRVGWVPIRDLWATSRARTSSTSSRR